jgi:hypothetical protein
MSATSNLQWLVKGWLLASLMIVAPCHAQKTEQVWGYKVRPGDRLVDIAKSYQKNPDDWKKLQQGNTVADPKLLQPGKQINIPVTALKKGDPFAAAVLVNGEVQRLDKSGQPVVKIASGDVLKMGDLIQTGPRSTLTIRFADDSRMLVTEKSKITLTSLVNYGKTGMADTKVQVHQGGTDSQVSPQKGPVARYEINTPAINLAVRGTDFRIQVDESNGATRTEVVEGLVAGDGPSSQAMIGAGFGIIARPGMALGQPTRLLKAPVLGNAPDVIKKLPALFEWEELPGALRYRVQMLVVIDGNDAIIVDEVSDNTKALWDELPDGDYVLRVRGIDAVGLEGANASKAFTVKTRPVPPELSLPINEHHLAEKKVIFQWLAAPQAQAYRFQLAEDADFKNLVAVVPKIEGSQRAVLLAVPAGQYYWRVASITSSGEVGPYSDAFTFTRDRTDSQ